MTREEVNKMIDFLKEMFEKNAFDEEADWYNNVAQGIAFATNSIQQTEDGGEK
ncbi:MAG: hypothetical protein NC293_10070 [Roseburia sp.]|nr:hypothetical protein [Roseburia sp.]